MMSLSMVPKAASLLATLVLCSISIASADGNDRDGRLITVGPPVYPEYCLRKGLEGYVDFVFVVDTKGLVQYPTVVDVLVYRKSATKPVHNEKAKQKFIQAAKVALGNYRYDPPVKNGYAVETTGVKTRITFALED